MLEQLQFEGSRARSRAFVVSLGLHLLTIGALLYRPEPTLLQPTSSLRGNGGGSHSAVTLIAPGVSAIQEAKQPPHEEEEKKALALHRAPKQKVAPSKPQAASQPSENPGTPGFILGSLASGFVNEHDVRIAIPTFSPDPPIARSKLPDWIRGDVIIEVTISERGEVVETKVLQTVGYGLEVSVAETLRQWRFTPAVVDGIAVASRQDVHFHFPS